MFAKAFFVVISVLACALLASLAACAQQPHSDNEWGEMNELVIRRRALTTVQPVYPQESLRSGSEGAAVIQIQVSPGGAVTDASVLEAPDAAIGAAVLEAARRWTFRRFERDGAPLPFAMRSTLTFYFERSSGRVFAPGERLGAGAGESRPQVAMRMISESQVALEMTRAASTIIDVRRRAEFQFGHRDGAVNIPLGELHTRAPDELDRSGVVLVDCVSDRWTCELAGRVLASLGFSDVAVVMPTGQGAGGSR